jgi:hypothetical protein
MSPLSRHVQLEVSCPACPESYAVPLDVVEESHHLLDELGPCTGMASYECPATYFAGLLTTDAIAGLDGALQALDRDARRHGAKAVWVEPAPTTSAERREDDRAVGLGAIVQKMAEERALARDLTRWEGDGGAIT